MTDLSKLAASLSAHHIDILDRLAEGRPLKLASRDQDKLRRTLRQAAAIAHCGKPKRWQISGDGLQLRRYLQEMDRG